MSAYKSKVKTRDSRAPRYAKKSLGQNFLVDRNISAKIISAVSPSPGDEIVEIGPGKGALTSLLAPSGAKITAIEKDSALAAELKAELSGYPNLEIIPGDILDFELPPSKRRLKVVGNIPYNLTSPIVAGLVDRRERIEFAVLMVQDEVARRLAGSPGTKDYGALSIRLQLVAEIEKLFVVSPGCFRPVPKVDSRVIKITFTNQSPLRDEIAFVRFVKSAFGMRRKMFRHFVMQNYNKRAVDLIPDKYRTARVETFTPQEIYELFNLLENNALLA